MSLIRWVRGWTKDTEVWLHLYKGQKWSKWIYSVTREDRVMLGARQGTGRFWVLITRSVYWPGCWSHDVCSVKKWPAGTLFCRCDCGLNIRTSPKVICWNSSPWCDGTRRQGLWGVMGVRRGPEGTRITGGTRAPVRVKGALAALCAPPGEDTKRDFMSAAQPSPELTVLAPWAQPSSLKTCVKWTDAVYKASSLCYSS